MLFSHVKFHSTSDRKCVFVHWKFAQKSLSHENELYTLEFSKSGGEKTKTEKKIGKKAHKCKVSLAHAFSLEQTHRPNATHLRIQSLIFGHDFKVHFWIDVSIKSSFYHFNFYAQASRAMNRLNIMACIVYSMYHVFSHRISHAMRHSNFHIHWNLSSFLPFIIDLRLPWLKTACAIFS